MHSEGCIQKSFAQKRHSRGSSRVIAKIDIGSILNQQSNHSVSKHTNLTITQCSQGKMRINL